MKVYSIIFLVLLSISLATAFYLPGVAPKNYGDGVKVPLFMNKMVSSKTQLPYEYYTLNFCYPKEGVEVEKENLGEILLGDFIESSSYEIITGTDTPCKVLCEQPQTLEDLKLFEERIREEYMVNWILDNLPAATQRLKEVNGKVAYIYNAGFPLGVVQDDVAYINNHINMQISYHTSPDFEGRRIVHFGVEPQSIQHSSYDKAKEDFPETCKAATAMQRVSGHEEPISITFTYGVEWMYNELKWSSRWDVYLNMTDTQIHWFSIVNSLMIVLFLTGMVAMIMVRTLHADLRRYKELETAEEAVEETGWKLVHGDVFRPPQNPMLLSVLIGSGVQVFSMTIIILVFALLGFLSPANRGALMTAMLVLFVFMGLFAGYFSARVYKMFKGEHWRRNTLLTSTFFPGTCFAIFFILNVLLYNKGSSAHVPFGILCGLLALWFGISIPLTYFGSYLGFKKPAAEHPVRTNQIPRQVPDQVWYMQPIVSILMGGILPFGAIFIELFFILSSIWLHQFYYMFGFLFIVFVILIITCAEITIVMCYFQLLSEDYHWWWRSFLTSAASALYMFLYAVFYFFTKLDITSLTSIVLYFGYTFIMTLGFFVLTGCIGFYSCFFFVTIIYGSVKVE